jgi:hypothetical protein
MASTDAHKRRGDPDRGKTALTVIGVIVIVIVVGVVLYFFFSRPTPPPVVSCIQIPRELSIEENNKALDVKAKVEAAIKGQGDVVAKYDTVLHEDFAKLSNRNVTLYIFVQAIDCYLQHGNQASNAAANSMTELLRAELAQNRGSESLTGPLTAEEEGDIRKSPYAAVILKRLSTVR